MGLLNPTISYNTGRIVDPFSGLNNAFGNTTQAITADEADKARKDALALQAERYAKADAQQALTNDRNGVIDRNAADKLALEKAQRAALVSMANEPAYSQRMGVDQTATDKQFRGIYGQEGEKLAPSAAFNAIIAKHPSREYDTKSPTFKADYAKDQAEQWDAYNSSPQGQMEFARNASIQAQYEKLRPTQEAATDALTSIGIRNGGDPTQVSSLAAKLASSYESTKDLETQAKELADSDRARKEMLFKEEMKTYNKGISNKHGNGATGTSSTATVATKWPELYAKIVNMQGDYGAGDANDLLTMAKEFEASGKTSGVKTTPQQFLNSLNRSTTAGRMPFIGDNKAYTDSNIKENLVKELMQGGTISTSRTLPTLKQDRSASDYLREVKDSREKLRSDEFAAMAKKYPANGSTEPSTPEQPVTVADAEKAKQEEAKKAAVNYTPPAPVTPSTSDSMLERIKQIDAEAGTTTDPRVQQRLRDERITIAKQLSVNATEQRQLIADEQQRSMLKRLGGQQVATDAGINVAEVPSEVITKAQSVVQQPSTVVGANGTTSILDSIRSNYSAGAPVSSALSTFNKYVLGDEVPQPLDSKMYSRIGHDEQAIRKQIGTNNPRETWEAMYRLSQSPEDKAMFGKLIQLDKYDNDAEYRNNTQMSSAKHVAGNTVINAAGGPLLRGLGKVAGTALEYGGKLVPFTKSVSNAGKAITRVSTAKKPVGFGQSTTAELSTKTGVADQAAYDATAKALELDKQILKRTKNVDKVAARKELIAAKEKVLKTTPQVTNVVTKSGGKFRPNEGTLATLTKSGRPSKEAQSQIDFIVESMGLNSKAAAKDMLKKRLAQDVEYRQKLYRNALLRTTGTTTGTTGDQLTK